VKEVIVKPVEDEIAKNTPPATAQDAEAMGFGGLITVVDETGAVLGVLDNPPAPNLIGKVLSLPIFSPLLLK
jgi:hypothetical protein